MLKRLSKKLEELLAEASGQRAAYEAQEKRLRLAETLNGFTATLGYINKPFHNEWYHLLASLASFVLLAPRGHAKSTCCGVNYPLFRILQDPNVRILLISGILADARRLVGEILLNIEQRYPWLRDTAKKWTESEAFAARTMISKDPTLRAAGIFGVKPGPRADLIICDDVVNEENASSALLRAKVMIKIKKVVLPMLDPGGQIVFDGTPYHHDDAYAQLKREGWRTHVYRAEIEV